MAKFIETPTNFEGLYIIERSINKDRRGYFERLFCPFELKTWRDRPVAQVNHSHTIEKGSIRGLHYQNIPHLDAKLITCIQGQVLDIALDLRASSPTFGQVFVAELSAEDYTSILIPEGFAHGFQSLSADVEMLYVHSQRYVPSSEEGVNVFDTTLNIPWKLQPQNISERDLSHPNLSEVEAISV